MPITLQPLLHANYSMQNSLKLLPSFEEKTEPQNEPRIFSDISVKVKNQSQFLSLIKK